MSNFLWNKFKNFSPLEYLIDGLLFSVSKKNQGLTMKLELKQLVEIRLSEVNLKQTKKLQKHKNTKPITYNLILPNND